jgi:regulator of sirC expression with transglutaminase-like and TPR domain
MLANLRHHYAVANELSALAWVLELRVGVPGVDPAERLALGSALSGLGRYGDAARALEALASTGHDDADRLRRQAAALRARLN